MCVKLAPGDLNLGLYPPHPTNTYTCEVTITPRVCDGLENFKYELTKGSFKEHRTPLV